jgi:putative mycofactocin binding protein MftB
MSALEPVVGGRWKLHPRVALRPEPFGALAYHYDTRKLNFVRSPDLVRVVQNLANHPSPRAAFDDAGVSEHRWPAFASALAALARSGFIERLEPNGTTLQEDGQVDADGTTPTTAPVTPRS